MTMPRYIYVWKATDPDYNGWQLHEGNDETPYTKYTRSDINADLVESLRNLLEWREADGRDLALLRQLEDDARTALKSVGEL